VEIPAAGKRETYRWDRQERGDVQSTFNENCTYMVIRDLIGATGAISKSFRKYVSNIPGTHEVKELQKTAILGTAHILRKVLMYVVRQESNETGAIFFLI